MVCGERLWVPNVQQEYIVESMYNGQALEAFTQFRLENGAEISNRKNWNQNVIYTKMKCCPI